MYEKYYKDNKDKKYDIYAYSAPGESFTYTINGKEIECGEDFRTPERYREYKETGFNILLMQLTGNYYGEEWETSRMKKVLDNAYAGGIDKVIVYDERIISLSMEKDGIVGEDKRFKTEKELDEYILNCIEPYKDHPAFYGIQLMDEPSYLRFKAIGSLYRSIKRVSPNTYIQCNLLPLCSPWIADAHFPDGDGSIIKRFSMYLESFLDATGANYFLFDIYPIATGVADSFILRWYFRALQVAADVSKRRGVKFCLIMQSYGMFSLHSHRFSLLVPKESQMYYQVYMALGFGVKEFVYYFYWSRTSKLSQYGEMGVDGMALMTRGGNKTPLYYIVQNINTSLQKLAPVMTDFEYSADRYLLKTPCKSHPFYLEHSDRKILANAEGETSQEVAMVCELYDKKRDNYCYCIINSTDVEYADICDEIQETMLKFKRQYSRVDVFENGEWRTEKIDNNKYIAKLKAGYGQIVLPY